MDANSILLAVSAVLARHVKPGDRLTVGLSGGVDSVVALHLLKALAGPLSFSLAAHHVNHRISAHADAWMDFCAGLCLSWAVPFSATAVPVSRGTGKGLEASARSARYRALAAVDCDFVVLAHHQDDQAETLLLQLLRGAGVRGLSGMAEVRDQESEVRSQESEDRRQECAATRLLRPLLRVSRADIEGYARAEHLAWIDDESNDDIVYSRNYLRWRVMPHIASRFPGYQNSFSSAAVHCAEASELLDDLAAIDARQSISGGRLAVDALASLSPPRGKNLLRYFIHQHGLLMPDQERLREMLRQLVGARRDAQVRVVHDGRELRRFRGHAYVVEAHAVRGSDTELCWRGEPRIDLGQLRGSLHFERVRGSGMAVELLLNKPFIIRFRRGGERLRLRAGGPSRSLKNLLQEFAFPPWRRDRLPLLYRGETLAAVPGIGVHEPFQCLPDSEGVIVSWPVDR